MLSRLLVAAAAFLASHVSATIYYAGVAQSGGEFGIYSATKSVGTGLPGTFGVDYQFISKPGVDIYVDTNKANLFRVAFIMERMCPVATGLGSKFNETHFSLYQEAIDYITITKGAYAILDPHNYMRYNDPSQQPLTGSIIGDTNDTKAATTAQFGEFWGELGGRFKNNSKVIFGLMNEPHDMPTSLILANNQAAITAIRATGASNLIIAPGNGYTGGHAWTTSYPGNQASSEYLYKLSDPLNNTALDIHEYLDADGSGGALQCSLLASTALAPLTAWLKQYGLKAMITEWGAANGTQCSSYVTDMLGYMAKNEEYIGWTVWAAGAMWGTASPCCTSGGKYGSFEPGSLAADGSPGLYTTVWQAEIQPQLPTTLQWSGAASVLGPAWNVSSGTVGPHAKRMVKKKYKAKMRH